MLLWNPERGKESNPSQSVHLSTDCMEGTHFLHVCFILRRIIEFHEHPCAESIWVKYTCILAAAVAFQFISRPICIVRTCIHHGCLWWWRGANALLSFRNKNIRPLGCKATNAAGSLGNVGHAVYSSFVIHERHQCKKKKKKQEVRLPPSSFPLQHVGGRKLDFL